MAGATIMFFDNVEHPLTSPSLAAALTSPDFTDRILQRSEIAKVPQRATWIATGNNIRVGGDLVRRCYWIRLDAGVARPWQREGFKHANLRTYVRANRAVLLAAGITLARAWFADGRPKATVPKLGGFDAWAGTLGGVLAHAGIEGFLGNLEQLYDDVDEEDTTWQAILALWFDTYGERAVTAATVEADLRRAGDGSALHEALPGNLLEALGGKPGLFSRRLGNALAKRKEAIFGGFRLVRAGQEHQAALWKVVRAQEGSPGSPGFQQTPRENPQGGQGEKGPEGSPGSLGSLFPPETGTREYRPTGRKVTRL